jgi:hypothetical protein
VVEERGTNRHEADEVEVRAIRQNVPDKRGGVRGINARFGCGVSMFTRGGGVQSSSLVLT